MFTQCPQCEAAFRITVDVLQQARGQVRCGSCDHAFNALDHLSEQPPESRRKEPEASSDDEDLERSQLLETLDRLAGTEDVRIEDTGVEWRVVDDGDAEDEPETDTMAAEAEVPQGDAGSSSLRWILEDADETLDGEDIPDTAETAQNEVLSAANSENADDPPANDEEPRYDDNTLLPDDFEEQHQYTAPTPQRRATDHFEFVIEDEASPQSDLELSEPDDWTDLLDDLGPSDPEGAEPGLATSGAAEPAPEPDTDDAFESATEDVALEATEPGTPAADTTEEPVGPDPDRDEEIALVASQLDELLDTMGTKPVQALADSMHEGTDKAEEEVAGDDAPDQASLAAATDDDAPIDDLADEQVEQSIEELIDESINELMDEQVDASTDESVDESIDEHIDEAIDDIVNDVVEAAEHPVPYADVVASDDEPDDVVSQDDTEGSAETEADVAALGNQDEALELDSTDVPEFIDIDSERDEPTTEYTPDDAADDQSDADAGWAFDDTKAEVETSAAGSEAQTADEFDLADDAEPADTRADSADEADVDDELADLAAMTGNMPIDADMLRAMRDSDFAATMTNEDGSPVVETIIMEGDQVSDSLADRELTGRLETLTDPASFIDTYITKKGTDAASGQRTGKRALALAAGLLVLLVAQFVHHTRESLATIGAFNQTIGPLYQMLGDPITPNWDIKGWQFEATNGSTDESDSVLTIYSRLSNRATDALPYPIVHVALTDRFEEVIGSRMLDPSEYLAGNADPERSVPAGANFTAVITIAAPADEATGFKLNVCYPASGGQLRCAIEDFKTP